MDFDRRDVDGRSRNYTSSNDPTVLIGKLVAQAFANSPLNATLREIPKRIAKDIESSLSHVGKRFQQGILQMTSDLNHQFASLGKRLAELGPPTTEMVLAAYDASKALSEGNAEPMDRFLVDYLKLSATPENRELLRNIVDSSLERDIRDVRDQWKKYEDDESAEITSVFLIVAVDHSEGEATEVSWGVSPGMPMHEGLGLLRYVEYGLLRKHD